MHNRPPTPLLLACAFLLFAATYGGGVFCSTDNGASWVALAGGLTSYEVHSLAVDGTSLFAGTYGSGVWRHPLN